MSPLKPRHACQNSLLYDGHVQWDDDNLNLEEEIYIWKQ